MNGGFTYMLTTRFRFLTKFFSLLAMLCFCLFSLASPQAIAATSPCASPDDPDVQVMARPAMHLPFTQIGKNDPTETPYLDLVTEKTYVPVRSFVEALSPAGVSWDAVHRTAVFRRGRHRFSFTFTAGSATSYTAIVDGEPHSVYSFICGDKIWAPARFMINAFDLKAHWYYDRTLVVDPAWTEGDQGPPGGW